MPQEDRVDDQTDGAAGAWRSVDKHSEEEDRQNAGADKALKLLDEGEYAAELRVAHKTEAGGIRLDLSSADEVSRAVAQMSQLSETFLIEKMVENVVAELIVGVARDDQFGPYLLVGGGGILVEMMKDSASLLLPVTGERVLEALRGLKCAPLLHGFRDDPELRVAILTGAGEKFFSGGWDLNAVAAGEEYLGDYGEGGFGGFPEMTDLLKPVICAVNGLAVGAGFEMLCGRISSSRRSMPSSCCRKFELALHPMSVPSCCPSCYRAKRHSKFSCRDGGSMPGSWRASGWSTRSYRRIN